LCDGGLHQEESFARIISATALYSGGIMTWVKPEFEIVELCSEVTSYLHHR